MNEEESTAWLSGQPPSNSLSIRAARSLWRPFVWRGLAFTVVYLVSVAALVSGVGVSERDLTDSGLAEMAYYALGLFVLGGLDLGTPVGGPDVARMLLWVTYFASPIITASAIIETALRLVSPLALRVRPMSGHVVLGGAGRLTLLYVRKLRQKNRRRGIVVVERSADHPLTRELQDVHRAVVVTGDVASDQVLRGLRLHRAHRMLLLTGDDFANLDASAKALAMAPGLAGRIVAHVSDLGFLRETSDANVGRQVETFNGHEFAAERLVQEHLATRFRSTPQRDLVVIAGFGRFGQTVLNQLQTHAPGSFDHVVVLDDVATRNARTFEDVPGFADDYRRTVMDGDLRDPVLWRKVGEIIGEHGGEPVVIIGSGNDGTNLQVAHRVRRFHPDAFVIVRSFRRSPFTDAVAEEAGMFSFNLGQLVQEGMPDGWF